MADNNMKYIIPIGIIGVAGGIGGYYLYKYFRKKKEPEGETQPLKSFNPVLDKVLIIVHDRDREPSSSWYEIKDPNTSIQALTFRDILRIKLVVKNIGNGAGAIRIRVSAKTVITYCIGFRSGPFGDLFCDGYKDINISNTLGDWIEIALNPGDIREFNYCAKPYVYRQKGTLSTRYTINVDMYSNSGNGWKPTYIDQRLFGTKYIGFVTTYSDSTYVLGKC